MEQKVYKWTKKDKLFYITSMFPFAIVFIGTAYLLASYSIYLLIIFVALYIITNVFQAGCCVGCPYQGKYCPALCGVYLGNWLSGILFTIITVHEIIANFNKTEANSNILVTGNPEPESSSIDYNAAITPRSHPASPFHPYNRILPRPSRHAGSWGYQTF